MSAQGRLTPDNAAPAADASNFLSSPVKSSKNVAGHDREEVARKVLPDVMGSDTRPELFFDLCKKSGSLDEFTKRLVSEEKKEAVEYLNELSQAVREKDCISDSIRFVLSEDTSPEEHPTGTKCRPDFVAIKIAPNVEYPPIVTLQQKVVSRSQSANKRDKQDELGWSQLEATGEIASKGRPLKEVVEQGASYTVYLLQARPDLVSVVGILIHPTKSAFQLYFTDAWGVCCTQAIGFGSENAIPLLVAWIRHLYDPELRPNIRRVCSFPNKPTFTIVTSDLGEFTGCELLSVGSPFHRRSTVFTVLPPSPPQTPLVIKSQYVENRRRFKEARILGTIHESRDFPGVVRLVPATGALQGPAMVEVESDGSASSSRGSVANVAGEGTVAQMRDNGLEADVAEHESTAEEVISSEEGGEATGEEGEETSDEEEEDDSSWEETSGEEEEDVSRRERESAASVDADWPNSRRDKDIKETLLVFQDKAAPLMDAETPLEALIAFYDLLEVTRFLNQICKILHRDISSGNVLLRPNDWKPEKEFEGNFGDMCFASHLLGEIASDTQMSRLYTRVVLIDFDMAEDRGTASGKPATDRSGTPMFMARLVRKSMINKGRYFYPQMPQLQGLALERYKTYVGNRLSEFPQNDESLYKIEENREIKYSHRLSYDAEAILWLLLWWAVQAKPVDADDENHIHEDLWVDLTGGEGAYDPRKRLVSAGLEDVCHPVYRGLDELLRSLFEQLSGYQEQLARPEEEQDSSRMKAEYLHEAFQRTILDFIVKNIKEPFMRERISPTRRPKQGGGMAQSIKTPATFSQGVKRQREAGAGEETDSRPFKKTKKVKVSTKKKPPKKSRLVSTTNSTSHPV